MANFQDSRFLGISPRTLGLGIVAVGVVVGLFFIPETVRFLFDAKPRTTKPRTEATKQSVVARAKPSGEAKAALSPEALNEVNVGMQRGEGRKDQTTKSQANGAKATRKGSESDEGLFSGWNFQVKADHSAGAGMEIPSSLTFDKILSKEGASFFKRGRGPVKTFLQREGFSGTVAEDSVSALLSTIDLVASASPSKASLSVEEVGNRLRSEHVQALRGLKAAGADRGLLLRWLRLPVIEFVDRMGNVGAARRIRANFAPRIQLTQLAVRDNSANAWSGNVRDSAGLEAQFSVHGSDVERIGVYSNGRLTRTIRLPKTTTKGERNFRISGSASGMTTLIAYDVFGARSFVKSYAFYPRVRVFRQDARGMYQIGFLPGSAEDSLDRFFFVGGTSVQRSRDAMVSQF